MSAEAPRDIVITKEGGSGLKVALAVVIILLLVVVGLVIWAFATKRCSIKKEAAAAGADAAAADAELKAVARKVGTKLASCGGGAKPVALPPRSLADASPKTAKAAKLLARTDAGALAAGGAGAGAGAGGGATTVADLQRRVNAEMSGEAWGAAQDAYSLAVDRTRGPCGRLPPADPANPIGEYEEAYRALGPGAVAAPSVMPPLVRTMGLESLVGMPTPEDAERVLANTSQYQDLSAYGSSEMTPLGEEEAKLNRSFTANLSPTYYATEPERLFAQRVQNAITENQMSNPNLTCAEAMMGGATDVITQQLIMKSLQSETELQRGQIFDSPAMAYIGSGGSDLMPPQLLLRPSAPTASAVASLVDTTGIGAIPPGLDEKVSSTGAVAGANYGVGGVSLKFA